MGGGTALPPGTGLPFSGPEGAALPSSARLPFLLLPLENPAATTPHGTPRRHMQMRARTARRRSHPRLCRRCGKRTKTEPLLLRLRATTGRPKGRSLRHLRQNGASEKLTRLWSRSSRRLGGSPSGGSLLPRISFRPLVGRIVPECRGSTRCCRLGSPSNRLPTHRCNGSGRST